MLFHFFIVFVLSSLIHCCCAKWLIFCNILTTIKINNEISTITFFSWIISFINWKRISCFLSSRENKWFNFSNDLLLLNDLSVERFFKTFRHVIEKTLFKLSENRIFVRAIIVCAFETMLFFSSILVISFRTFLLLLTIFELQSDRWRMRREMRSHFSFLFTWEKRRNFFQFFFSHERGKITFFKFFFSHK